MIRAVESRRSPRVLAGGTDRLSRLESALTGKIRNVMVLKAAKGPRPGRFVSEAHYGLPYGEQRLILAMGSYIGFDDARLDALFPAYCWSVPLQEIGRLDRPR